MKERSVFESRCNSSTLVPLPIHVTSTGTVSFGIVLTRRSRGFGILERDDHDRIHGLVADSEIRRCSALEDSVATWTLLRCNPASSLVAKQRHLKDFQRFNSRVASTHHI